MRKAIFILVILSLTFFLFSQQEQHEVTVRNVEVPVRVFADNQFVDNLTIEDFEIFENGIPQKIEALYLGNKNQITRQQELKNFAPQTKRNYFLIFQIIEYNPKLEKSIDHFFKNVLLPQDSLTLMTPQKNYHLSSEALSRKKKEDIAKEMLKILKKDTKTGSSAYRSQMRSLKGLVSSISGRDLMADPDADADFAGRSSSLGMLLRRYRNNLEKMEGLRIVDQELFLQFARRVKAMEGQKHVFFFYEREFRPELSPQVSSNLVSEYHDQPSIMGDLQDLFQFYQRHERINSQKITQAFADASICFNLLFVDREERDSGGITMREQSEDLYKAFSETAKATGGVVDTSRNPSAGFQNALTASENFYLLYYSPANYTADGSYKNIQVRVKDKKYKVSHRKGYYATD
jgi:VWFA-related protein